MDNKEILKQKGFGLTWDSKAEKSTSLSDGYFAMRGWQAKAFELLQSAPFMIVNAPMGSGKSWLICLLTAFKLKNDSKLRAIITVPQTIIGAGFAEAKFQMPNGEKIDWEINHNLCNKNQSSTSTVNYLIKWLENPLLNFSDRVILCTHATLVAAYRKLKLTKRLDLLDQLLIWIDEAHHVKNLENEGFEGAVISNGLGELVSFSLNNSSFLVQIGLTTASFFRGDRHTVLTSEMESRFTRFNLPWDEYLRSMTYLKSFNFDFLICGPDYAKAIELLAQRRKAKDIIYIPHPNSQCSTGEKYQEVEKIINTLNSAHKGTICKVDNGLTIIKQENSDFKILDLVDENQRIEKKNFLNDPKLKKDRDALDVIIALGMFKEGANWIWAERAIIVGARSSLVDVIQMVGRPFRDAPGKSHVEVIQLLPFSLEQQDDEKFRNNLNNYLKAIYASLILENIFNPVRIKIPVEKKDNEVTNADFKKDNDWLGIVVPDEGQRGALIEDVGNQLINIVAVDPIAAKDPSWILDKYQKIIPQILHVHGIVEHEEEVAKQIWGMFARQTLRMQGISVEDIDFDILQKTDPLEFLLRYTSGLCDINTFQKLREAIAWSRIAWRPFEEARDFVRSLQLQSETEWRKYISNQIPNLPMLPNDIPRAPWVAYRENGWTNWGDFLGTNTIAPRFKKYRSYEEAVAFVGTLHLHNRDAWIAYSQGQMPHLPLLPDDIPAAPGNTYKRKEYGNKWNGWGDFLGTNRISNQAKSKKWMSYQETHKFVANLNLLTADDWLKYIKGEFKELPSLPHNLPRKPHEVYEEEWVDWPTFLGNRNISKFSYKRTFWPFEKARDYARSLGLKTQKEWHNYCAGNLSHLSPKPLEVPSSPAKKYKNNGWVNLKDWLGTNAI